MNATTLAAGLPSARGQHRLAELTELAAPRIYGYVSRVVGLSITVSGLTGRIGDLLTIGTGPQPVLAEVVAVDQQNCTCLPLGSLDGIGNGDRVAATGGPLRVGVGAGLRGRVLDGLGQPLDGRPLPPGLDRVSVEMAPPAALSRRLVDEQLSLGVRAIDSLISVGRGQRVGIFAGSGVGKSSLLSMITRGTTAQITVVALIGERGREVREFLENDLGPDGLRDAVVKEIVNTPATWKETFNLDKGAILGLSHSFFNVLSFRPSTRCPGVEACFFVGASTHPGTGVPICLAGSKITAGQVLESFGVEKPWATEKTGGKTRRTGIDRVETLPLLSNVHLVGLLVGLMALLWLWRMGAVTPFWGRSPVEVFVCE